MVLALLRLLVWARFMSLGVNNGMVLVLGQSTEVS
jgi:hypothetical protein